MSFELLETLKSSITSYTGLSPATFFTAIALLWAIFYLIKTIFAPSDYSSARAHSMHQQQQHVEPLQPPVQLGEITLDELKKFDGSDPSKPLLMAIKGQIYDVSQSRGFYGPGGPYALFAGKDASRALAKMSFEDVDLTGDISGLGPFELDALQDWEWRFTSKYVKVGTIKTTEGTSDDKSAETSNVEPAATGEKPESIPSGSVTAKADEAIPSEGAADKTE